MLVGAYQVVDVLFLVCIVAPIAMYFLFLGLVNSHSRPYLTTPRNDFISLTIVLAPLLLWPIPVFSQSGIAWTVACGVIAGGVIFLWMLPCEHAGFVIYNISESRCRRLLAEIINHLGWRGRWTAQTWSNDEDRVRIIVRGFALLRNVTIHIETENADFTPSIHKLQAELDRRLQSVSQLPSSMGTCLVLLGAMLLIIPMWMIGRHIDALVDAMSHLFG